MTITQQALAAMQPPNGDSASAWAMRINACWQASVKAIIEVGRLLSEAKQALAHGEFGAMIDSELPFSARTAQMLMAIAADFRLTNTKHVSYLPASWGTLYELTKLTDEQFEKGIAEKIIRPDMERREVINGARSLMGSRQEPDDSLDYFPTPPFATRALLDHVLPKLGVMEIKSAWEPACGEGHITGVLQEYGVQVYSTDIFDYNTEYQDRLCDFLNPDDYARHVKPDHYDWIITNPPFGDNAIKFVLRGLDMARIGVAMFFRSQWAVEGKERYEKLFCDRPPTLCAFFVERVNLRKGYWDPNGGTATAYCWLVWIKGEQPSPPFWIPPGCRKMLTRDDDTKRFTSWLPDDASPHDPDTGEIIESAEDSASNPGATMTDDASNARSARVNQTDAP